MGDLSMRFLVSAGWLLLAMVLLFVPASSHAGIFIGVDFAPPALPVYEQPDCPQPGAMWTPGYWAYDQVQRGYYWIPGAWVPAPYEGALWTPGYWGWEGGRYFFHEGYWGRRVGYYGGVNYGFGYGGVGFSGGEWRGREFHYNTYIMHVDRRYVHNTFEDRRRVERGWVERDSHVAFSGGPGGIRHEPVAEERLAERDEHQGRTSFQEHHENFAKNDKSSYANNNGGHPSHGSMDAQFSRSGSGNYGGSSSSGGGASAHAISIENNQGSGSSKNPTPIEGNSSGTGNSTHGSVGVGTHSTHGTGSSTGATGIGSTTSTGTGITTGSTGAKSGIGSTAGNSTTTQGIGGSTGSTSHTLTNMSVKGPMTSGGGAPNTPNPCKTGNVNGVCSQGPSGGSQNHGLPVPACTGGKVRDGGGNCVYPACTVAGTSRNAMGQCTCSGGAPPVQGHCGGKTPTTGTGAGTSPHLGSGNSTGGQTTLPVAGNGGAKPMISHASGGSSTSSQSSSGSQGSHSNPQPPNNTHRH